jgi:hypothetical protein
MPNEYNPTFPSGVPNLRANLFDTHAQLCEAAARLMQTKNVDYACQADPFRNFRMFGPISVLCRLSDKLSRLRSYEENGGFKVEDENLLDTVLDTINYAVIYYGMKTEK